MPEQLTTELKAEEPQHRLINVPTTKKLRKASSQLALNSPPRSVSAIDSSLSESPPSPSLTSGSSIEDSSSSTRATSTSMLQETRPNHGSAQETKEPSWREFGTMSREKLKEYVRSRGWKVPPNDEPDIEYDSDDDPYQRDIDAWKGEFV